MLVIGAQGVWRVSRSDHLLAICNQFRLSDGRCLVGGARNLKGKDMGAGNLTDEQLLKRAGNAARNLRILGILATLGALMIGAMLLVGKGATAFMWPVALAVTSLAAGYWTLAVAARRGNPNSV